MQSKTEAQTRLERARDFDELADRIRDMIRSRRQKNYERATQTAASYSFTGAGHNHNPQRMEAAIVAMIDADDAEVIEQLKKALAAAAEAQKEARQLIFLLPDARKQYVLLLRYLCGMKYEQIAPKTGLDEVTVKQLHGEALAELDALINPPAEGKKGAMQPADDPPVETLAERENDPTEEATAAPMRKLYPESFIAGYTYGYTDTLYGLKLPMSRGDRDYNNGYREGTSDAKQWRFPAFTTPKLDGLLLNKITNEL